jgi:hypothetical protein
VNVSFVLPALLPLGVVTVTSTAPATPAVSALPYPDEQRRAPMATGSACSTTRR